MLCQDKLAVQYPTPVLGFEQDELEAKEGSLHLAQLMARLPDGYRSVLLLKYDNGYSTAEIARHASTLSTRTESPTIETTANAAARLLNRVQLKRRFFCWRQSTSIFFSKSSENG